MTRDAHFALDRKAPPGRLRACTHWEKVRNDEGLEIWVCEIWPDHFPPVSTIRFIRGPRSKDFVLVSSTKIRKIMGSTPGDKLVEALTGLTLNPALLVEMLRKKGLVMGETSA